MPPEAAIDESEADDAIATAIVLRRFVRRRTRHARVTGRGRGCLGWDGDAAVGAGTRRIVVAARPAGRNELGQAPTQPGLLRFRHTPLGRCPGEQNLDRRFNSATSALRESISMSLAETFAFSPWIAANATPKASRANALVSFA